MYLTLAQLILALSLCLAVAIPTAAQPVDQLPMYGGLDRKSDSSLRAADEKLIADTTRHYGSREKASAAFVGNGFSFYGRNDLVSAMRRFNQAWLLDPNNPEVYFGFAIVLHDKGRNCDAVTQFEKAASFGRFVQGMAPDAARVLVLCAVGDKSLAEEAKAALLVRSDALYAEALTSESDKGYVYASMASALYWRGKYAEAWVAVKLARSNGGSLPEQFLLLLQEKMPEPA